MLDENMAKFIAANLRARKQVLEHGGKAEVLERLDRAIGLMDEIANGNTIESGWSIEDVFSLTDDEGYEFNYDEAGNPTPPSDITVEQARAVLQAADNDHDANIGINWDVLQYHLDRVRSEDESDNV